MTLLVADPFAYETAAGPDPCLGLRMALGGDERELTGTWMSASCPQGGIITLRR